MKTHLAIILLGLLFPVTLSGQVGNTQSNPIVAGTFGGGFDYSNSQNTANFTNNYTGRSTNDVYYRFTLTKRMEVIMRHCGSTVSDTYLNLLNASGNLITYNDDYSGEGGCGTTGQSYLKKELDAGTYYVVSEGYSQNGVIQTSITGIGGDTWADAIFIGTFNKSFKYSDIRNTTNYTNQYTERDPNDVFYKFTLNRRMNVTMNHYGSELSDTYMTLLDASGVKITYNDDYSGDGGHPSHRLNAFIQKTLEPGTYYIVSEGYSDSGIITTNLVANASEDFNYPDVPSDYSAESETVGGIGGQFDVSDIGGASYSIPIEVPPGVGGLQPSLAIAYNSQGANGIAGWGCNISGFSVITRTPKDIYHDTNAKGLTFSSGEAYCLDGKRLILSSGTAEQEGAVYNPESDPFTKVIFHGSYSSPSAIWFEVQASNGQIYYYGNTDSSRQRYTVNSIQKIYAWYLGYVEDPMGNTMSYTYNNWNYSMYPASITYGTNKNSSTGFQNTISFFYDSRSDIQPFVIEGQKGGMSYRLNSITSRTQNTTYRSYSLNYDTSSDGSSTKFSRLTSVTEKNGAGEAKKPIIFNWSFLPSFSQYSTSPQVSSPSTYPGMPFTDQQYIAGDFNGDGLADILGIAPVKIPTGPNSWTFDTYAYVYFASSDAYGNVQFTTGKNYTLGPNFQMGDWSEYRAGSSVIDFDGDGMNEFVVPHVSINSNWKQIAFYVYGNTVQGAFAYNLKYSSEMPEYATGDFNNDGKGDIVFIEKGQSGGKYPGELIGHNSGTALFRTAFNLSLPSKPEKLFASDFNGDGLEDILVFYNSGYTIYWNQGNGIAGTTFSDARRTIGTNIANVWMIRSGDFNGDGLMDFVMNQTSESQWYFALNNGDGTFTKTLACMLDLYDQSFTEKDNSRFECNVFDFDFDGKSDIVVTKAMYSKKSAIFQGTWGEFQKTYTSWLRSNGTTLTQIMVANSNRDEDAFSYRYILGDFNGDGQVELMNFGYNCCSSTNANSNPIWRMCRNSSFSADRGKISSITGDFGATTNITYASLVTGGFYTRGSGAVYPMADYTVPLHAVKSVTSNNGTAGSMNVNYQYSGLKMHLQGKRFLGMASMTVNNTTLGTVSESGVKSWNTTFYVPSATYSKSTVGGKTAESNVTITIVDKGTKRFFIYPATAVEKDLDGNTVTITRKFDAYNGYMTEEKADYGGNMYMITRYDSYILAGKSYKPQLVTRTQKHADDAIDYVQCTSIKYDATKGWQTQAIENFGTSFPLTTDYAYDAWGNVLTSKVTGSGITPLTNIYQYDFSKRFVAKEYTNPASTVITYTYDTWGNPLVAKDETNTSDILTTTYTYDGWGNRISTLLPDGTKQTYSAGWNGGNTAKCYFTLTQGAGEPWVKTWYDNQGREVVMETIGAKSMNVNRATTYDTKGQVTRVQTQTGGLTTTENSTYDGRGRVLTQSNSLGQNITYSYGNRTASSTLNSKTTTKTYDAWGNVKSVTDPVSSIAYTYTSLGKPQKIVTGGATFSMLYYDTGTQRALIDPDAGTSMYTYDAAGRLIKQVDGKGKTTSNAYNVLGQLTNSTIDGVVTTYTYGAVIGNDYLRLTKQQTGANSIAFAYDKYGRMKTETRQIDGGGTLAFGYGYNVQGQLSSIGYPGGLTVTRDYDAYGNLSQVKAGTQSIWELTGNTGLVTTSRLGGTLTATETHNSLGLLSNLKTQKGTTVLHNMDFVFNGATGNLTSRTGMIAQSESFVYDNAERLTTVQQAGSSVMSLTYQANGNILSKTGLGNYSYGKPHAVSAVDNTGGLIAAGNQTIGYTAFNKASSISETVGSDTYLLDIAYGPDQQRWKSTIKKNNIVSRSIIFADDYESITEGGVTKQLYYLSAGDGVAAVYVKQSGQTDKTYYVCKDHLGSIVKLVDVNGTEVFKASYDAWGKRTVTNSTFKFLRGYTGHEHLDEFSLINMNGRMYDPLLGRFLSPDPFVQFPDLSQNFNRYSYCLNNPLLYTDPSGEIFGIDDIIFAAAIGAVMNVAMQGMSGNINSTGDFFKAVGIGGLSGVAGSFAGQAVSSGLGISTSFGGAVSKGFVSGFAGGFTGGFISGSGNAWSNNASFSQGLKQGGFSGLTSGFMAGGISAISSGVNYQKQSVIFRKGNIALGIEEGNPVPATDQFLLDAQKAWYKDAPMDKVDVFTVEKVSVERLELLNKNNAKALTTPLTINKKYTGFSRVYFNKNLAFGSSKDLFFTMGHELVHVSQFAALVGQSSSIFTADFRDMLDYHAYSFEHSLGGVRLNSFSPVEISAWMKAFSQFNSLSPVNFSWTYNHSFKYPF